MPSSAKFFLPLPTHLQGSSCISPQSPLDSRMAKVKEALKNFFSARPKESPKNPLQIERTLRRSRSTPQFSNDMVATTRPTTPSRPSRDATEYATDELAALFTRHQDYHSSVLDIAPRSSSSSSSTSYFSERTVLDFPSPPTSPGYNTMSSIPHSSYVSVPSHREPRVLKGVLKVRKEAPHLDADRKRILSEKSPIHYEAKITHRTGEKRSRVASLPFRPSLPNNGKPHQSPHASSAAHIF
ncbi:hypothetical protein DL96DRAFT_1555846 [Flagelloscypha sp. PMI_526]|nr:hypothetical protein DL96DRAFT_1555846 [Flagelloscypha sp. PMI_526]